MFLGVLEALEMLMLDKEKPLQGVPEEQLMLMIGSFADETDPVISEIVTPLIDKDLSSSVVQ